MRLLALGTGCVATGVALTMLGSPAAQADDASFVRDVRALGAQQATTNLISTAQSACYFLGPRHRDPGQVEARIVRYTLIEPENGHQFLVLAVREYCPQFAGLVGA